MAGPRSPPTGHCGLPDSTAQTGPRRPGSICATLQMSLPKVFSHRPSRFLPAESATGAFSASPAEPIGPDPCPPVSRGEPLDYRVKMTTLAAPWPTWPNPEACGICWHTSTHTHAGVATTASVATRYIPTCRTSLPHGKTFLSFFPIV